MMDGLCEKKKILFLSNPPRDGKHKKGLFVFGRGDWRARRARRVVMVWYFSLEKGGSDLHENQSKGRGKGENPQRRSARPPPQGRQTPHKPPQHTPPPTPAPPTRARRGTEPRPSKRGGSKATTPRPHKIPPPSAPGYVHCTSFACMPDGGDGEGAVGGGGEGRERGGRKGEHETAKRGRKHEPRQRQQKRPPEGQGMERAEVKTTREGGGRRDNVRGGCPPIKQSTHTLVRAV